MSMVMVHLNTELEKIVGIVKSVYGFSSKDKAIQFILEKEGEGILEGELRPEFVKEILGIEKGGKFREFKTIKELRARIEHA